MNKWYFGPTHICQLNLNLISREIWKIMFFLSQWCTFKTMSNQNTAHMLYILSVLNSSIISSFVQSLTAALFGETMHFIGTFFWSHDIIMCCMYLNVIKYEEGTYSTAYSNTKSETGCKWKIVCSILLMFVLIYFPLCCH